MINLYKADITKTFYENDVLIVAKDFVEANKIAERIISFYDFDMTYPELFVDSVEEVTLTDIIKKDLKEYGYYGPDFKLQYDNGDLARVLSENKKKKDKEDWLKKHHLEFDFK